MTTKAWILDGEVTRHEKKDVTKRVSEGVGDNKTTRTVEEEVYILVVLGENGQRVRIQQDRPFEMNVGEDVRFKLEYGLQTRIEEHEEPPKKKGKGK